MALNDLWRVRFYCVHRDQAAVNVFHFHTATEQGGPVSNQAAADFLSNKLAPAYKAMMPSVAQYWGCDVQNVTPNPPGVRGESATGRGAGTNGTAVLAMQTTGLLHLFTPAAGQSFRGRLYVPFPSVTANSNDGKPTAAYDTACTNLGGLLVGPHTIPDGVLVSTLRGVIWSRKRNIFTAITSVLPGGLWATQRRRGDFGRPNDPPFV